MRATSRRYAALTTLALVLLVCLAALPTPAAAQAPAITIFGTGVERCTPTGRPVAVAPQGSPFQVDLSNFPPGPGFPSVSVFATVTFPNGRIYDLGGGELAAPKAPLAAPAFPPPALALIPITLDSVNASLNIPTFKSWPTGCYTLTVAQNVGGAPSATVRNTAQFRVQPFAYPTQPGNLQLTAHAAGTIQPTGQSVVAVNIFGRGPVGGPPPIIEMMGPDGAIDDGPFPATATGSPGGFATVINILLPAATGTHTVIAYTPTMSARAQFTLTAPPSTPPGNAVLTMEPSSTLVPHNPAVPAVINVGGRRLPPGAAVTAVLVMPNGGRLMWGGAPLPLPNASGNLALPAFALNRQFATGSYRLELWAVPAGNLLGSISWRVTP